MFLTTVLCCIRTSSGNETCLISPSLLQPKDIHPMGMVCARRITESKQRNNLIEKVQSWGCEMIREMWAFPDKDREKEESFSRAVKQSWRWTLNIYLLNSSKRTLTWLTFIKGNATTWEVRLRHQYLHCVLRIWPCFILKTTMGDEDNQLMLMNWRHQSSEVRGGRQCHGTHRQNWAGVPQPLMLLVHVTSQAGLVKP